MLQVSVTVKLAGQGANSLAGRGARSFPDIEALHRSFSWSDSPVAREGPSLGLGARIALAEIPLPELNRITTDPEVMGGKPCIRGMRVTVGTVVGLVAAGHSHAEILRLYPYLEAEDIPQALEYAAWRSEEIELPLARP